MLFVGVVEEMMWVVAICWMMWGVGVVGYPRFIYCFAKVMSWSFVLSVFFFLFLFKCSKVRVLKEETGVGEDMKNSMSWLVMWMRWMRWELGGRWSWSAGRRGHRREF